MTAPVVTRPHCEKHPNFYDSGCPKCADEAEGIGARKDSGNSRAPETSTPRAVETAHALLAKRYADVGCRGYHGEECLVVQAAFEAGRDAERIGGLTRCGAKHVEGEGLDAWTYLCVMPRQHRTDHANFFRQWPLTTEERADFPCVCWPPGTPCEVCPRHLGVRTGEISAGALAVAARAVEALLPTVFLGSDGFVSHAAAVAAIWRVVEASKGSAR